MKDNTLWEDALDHVEPNLVSAAARPRKKRRVLRLIGLTAAILAVVILLQTVQIPMFITARALSTADSPRITPRPGYNVSDEKWQQWRDETEARNNTVDAAYAQMADFLRVGCSQFLSGTEENTLYSPINVYMGLAMLAECTAGNSRAQLLDLLGAPDLESLRTQVSAIWEQVYHREQNQVITLANSLWLDSTLAANLETADALAYHHYASVYQRDLTAPGASRDIGAWLNNNTGGLLQEETDTYRLPESTLLALYSTIFFQGRWSSEFDPAQNTAGHFHTPTGNKTCTFMNARLREMNYYWGEDYGAVSLSLKNGGVMWFFLPDEDKTVDDVLTSGEYLAAIRHDPSVHGQSKYMKVNLSIPKFDISTTRDLKDGLQALGVTEVFNLGSADFSPITPDTVVLTAANQSMRVCIDEEGVKAAAYFELPGAGSAMPPDDIIDFILDRPFLFVITADTIPLFAGVVNQP